MRYYVYILHCSDNTYYTGVTNNLKRRLQEHETGLHLNSYVFKRRPFKLVYSEGFNDILAAIAWEKKLKGWSRGKKEALIKNNWDEVKALTECKNETHHKNFSKSSFGSAQDDNLKN